MTLLATLGVDHPITAALTGAGALAANTAASVPLSATLTGSGSLAADLILTIPLTATLSGTGTLTAATLVMSVPVTATLSGAGALSATTAADIPVTATLTGTGALAISLEVGLGVSIDGALTGTGSLTASLVISVPVEATLTGAGALTATTAAEIPITATLTGAGALAATVDVPSAAVTPAQPPPRGMTTLDLSTWIPVEPFRLRKYQPPIVTLGVVVFRVYPVFEAQAYGVPMVEAQARFVTAWQFRAEARCITIELRRIVFSAEADVMNGRSGGESVYSEAEDLYLSGALPPELALLEGLRRVPR